MHNVLLLAFDATLSILGLGGAWRAQILALTTRERLPRRRNERFPRLTFFNHPPEAWSAP
jgi:hypothetical protein